MRGPHGTAGRAPFGACGSTSSSAWVIDGWSFGLSRKYQYQTATQTKPASPTTTNEPRHVTTAISPTIRNGVSALPSREKECVMPCAKPRLRDSTQYCMARVAVGSVAPTPKPIRMRAKKSE